jgi:hypothetical protein
MRSRISTTAAELDSCAVADLTVSGDLDDAMLPWQAPEPAAVALVQRHGLRCGRVGGEGV